MPATYYQLRDKLWNAGYYDAAETLHLRFRDYTDAEIAFRLR